MRAYVVRRLLLVIPTLLLVTLGVFLNVRFIPGNVIDLMIAENLQGGGSIEDLEGTKLALRHQLGLDQPIHIQYLRWLGLWQQDDGRLHGVLQGDLGHSLWG
jgi:peptide/nickel transport system permease protein